MDLIIHYFELAAALAGSYYWLKTKDPKTRPFIWYLWFTITIETVALYSYIMLNNYDNAVFIWLKNSGFCRNTWLYNIYGFVGLILIGLFYIQQIEHAGSKRIIRGIVITCSAFAVFYFILSGRFFETYLPYDDAVRTFAIFTFVLLYLRQLLNSDRLLEFYKSHVFYISIGLMLWNICITPLFIFDGYHRAINTEFVVFQKKIFINIKYPVVFMLYFRVYNFIALQRRISAEEIALISYVIFFTLALMVVFVVFFVTFQRRKNKLLLDKLNQQKAFDEELAKTQREIQEETLKRVGQDLHDNIGQILSYTMMQLNAVVGHVPDNLRSHAEEASMALKNGLSEVRALSKSLNSDVIHNLGFTEILRNEIERLDKLPELDAQLIIEGDKSDITNKSDAIILFRILQEFYSNTMKYGEASRITTHLKYNSNILNIRVSDNGKGFDIDNAKKGSGLLNMKKRSELVKASFTLDSEINHGTHLSLNYPLRAN
jgi:signal transduction histidine kinase